MKISDAEKERRAAILTEQHSGIHEPDEIVYISHISSVSRLATNAFDRFENQIDTGFNRMGHEETFESLQTAISHSAALSRFFWPSRNGTRSLHKARGKKLRIAFRVNNDSPLKDRGLRDAIEHYDERLDLYHLNPKMGNIISLRINDEPRPNTQPSFILLKVDTKLREVNILGKEHGYGRIIKEVNRISDLAVRFSKAGYRLPDGHRDSL